MAGNTDPIYSKVGKISGVEVTAANTKSDGAGTIGTDIFLAFTADATNGSFVRDIKTFLTATTAATATTATRPANHPKRGDRDDRDEGSQPPKARRPRRLRRG